MKKLVAFLVCLMLCVSVTGCDKNPGDSSSVSTDVVIDDSTMGNRLAGMFLKGIADSNMQTLAEELASASEIDCVVVEAQEGYLNGFSEEIKGFKSGVQFSPMIGSIPFVGYIFETDTPNELNSKLEAVADPRWNICTEAAETVCVVSGNYVFFTMCPGEE